MRIVFNNYMGVRLGNQEVNARMGIGKTQISEKESEGLGQRDLNGSPAGSLNMTKNFGVLCGCKW